MAASLPIPIPDYSPDLLAQLLKAITQVDRKIAIAFSNYYDRTLELLGIHYERESYDRDLPLQLPLRSAGVFCAPQSQSRARETAGVLSYYIPAKNKTVHVMWSVPKEPNKDLSRWNVVVVPGNQRPTHDVYDDLIQGKGPFPDPYPPGKKVDISQNGFRLVGELSANGEDNDIEATLQVDLSYDSN